MTRCGHFPAMMAVFLSVPPSVPLSLSLPSAMASHVARVTFPPVHPPERASERAPFTFQYGIHAKFLFIASGRGRGAGRRQAVGGGILDSRHNKGQKRRPGAGGVAERAAEQMPSLTHSLLFPAPLRRAGCHRRFRIKIKSERRRPKSILGFCPDEFICLGHLTLHDFPPLSTPTEPNSLLSGREPGRLPALPPSDVPGRASSQHKIHFRTPPSIEPQLPRYLWPSLVCKL